MYQISNVRGTRSALYLYLAQTIMVAFSIFAFANGVLSLHFSFEVALFYLHDSVRFGLRFCNRTVWSCIARWLHIVSITQILLFTSMWCNWSIPFTTAHHTPHHCQTVLGLLRTKQIYWRKYCVKHKINYTHIEQNIIYCLSNRTKRMVKLTMANIVRLRCWDLCYLIMLHNYV